MQFVNGQKIFEYDHASDAYKEYDYNSLGQLESETNYKDNNNVAEYDYTYDASGNRIKMRSFNNTLGKWDTVTDYTYNANNQLTESATKVNNDLTEIKRYYYDDNGNTIAEQKKTYTTDGNISSDMAISGRSESGSVKLYGYDYFNRLIKYNDGKTTAEYTYGADNLRTSKTVNGTKTDFVWNGQNLAGETKNGTETVYTYDQTGIIASRKGAETAESFFKDAHGDVIAVSKGSNIAGTYDYTAFGNKWQGDEPDPFGYCGEYLDSENGLIYLRNRYYNSNTGRFINEDPYWNLQNMIYGDSESDVPDISAIMQSGNLYVYAMNNPINAFDPSGMTSWEDYKANEEGLLSDEDLGYIEAYTAIFTETNNLNVKAWAHYATQEIRSNTYKPNALRDDDFDYTFNNTRVDNTVISDTSAYTLYESYGTKVVSVVAGIADQFIPGVGSALSDITNGTTGQYVSLFYDENWGNDTHKIVFMQIGPRGSSLNLQSTTFLTPHGTVGGGYMHIYQ